MFEPPNYKKIILTILAVIAIVAIAVILLFTVPKIVDSSSSSDYQDTEYTPDAPETEESKESESDDSAGTDSTEAKKYVGIHARVDYATALVMKDEANLVENHSISLSMAQNEKEGMEYIIAAESKFNNLSCAISDLSDKDGNTIKSSLYFADYTNVTRTMYPSSNEEKNKHGYYPDALLPYDGTSFVLEPHQSQTIYARFDTDFETVPGIYTGTISLLSNGKPINTCSIEINVWDLAYPEKTACKTAVNNWWDASLTGIPDDMVTFKKYYDFLLDNRLNGYYLPFNEYDEDGVEEYLNNDRVNTCRVYELTPAARSVLTSNEEWLKKAYYYPVDEPLSGEALEEVRREYELKQSAFPEVSMMTPFPEAIQANNGQNVFDYLKTYNKILCPNADLFRGEYLDKLQSIGSSPDTTLWWYVCGGQSLDSIDLLASTPGLEKRILFWQQYQNNVEGFLYWSSCYWQGLEYEETPTTDGILAYIDKTTGEPIGTLGLEAVRDGIEDFQLLHMGEEILGKDAVAPYVEAITTSITEWDGNVNNLMKQRNALAEAIIAHRD